MPTRAQEFIKTVATDETLRQNLENAATSEARRKVIDAAGFADVSKEDIAAAVKQQATEVNTLSDAELEAVAGGDSVPTIDIFSMAFSIEQISETTISIVAVLLL